MSNFLLSALGVVCPSCDEYNEPLTQKCFACSTPLSTGVSAAASSGRALGDEDGPPTSSFGTPVSKTLAARPAAQPATPPAPAPSPVPAAAPVAAKPAVKSPEAGPPGMKPASRTGLPAIPPAARPAAPAAEAPKAPAAAARPPAQVKFGLTVVAGPTAGQRFRLAGTAFLVGRSRGAIQFAEDPFVSAAHAAFMVKDGKLFVRDEASASGVFVAISAPETINVGTSFSTVNRVFRYLGPLQSAPAPAPGRPAIYGAPVPQGQVLHSVEEVLVGGRAGKTVISAGALLTIGQGKCDLSYPGDEEMATRHCEVSPTASGAVLRDLSGGAGTFVRLQPGVERPVAPGGRVRIGQQVLQVEAFA